MLPSSQYAEAQRLLKHPRIRPLIEADLAAIGQALQEEVAYTIAQALSDFVTIATADPDEVTGLRTGACRHCWSENHEYHWKEHEYLAELATAEREGRELPEIAGGFGYRKTAQPNPECPECEGEGVVRQVPVDTSKLSPGGKMLFQGVKPTRNGVEVKLADREKARENAAKIIGAFKEQPGPMGPVVNLNAADLKDPQAAARAYQDFIKSVDSGGK